MRAIERTTALFLACLGEAVPDLRVSVERSSTRYGRSNYVHIRDAEQRRYWKVRISDHAVDMRRAQSGREDFYIQSKDKPGRWAVWLGDFRREVLG